MNEYRIQRIANSILAFEFPTQDAMDKYLKEHPAADESKHRVIETKKEPAKKEEPAKDKSRNTREEWDGLVSDYLLPPNRHKLSEKDKKELLQIVGKSNNLKNLTKLLVESGIEKNKSLGIVAYIGEDVAKKTLEISHGMEGHSDPVHTLCRLSALSSYVGSGYRNMNHLLKYGKLPKIEKPLSGKPMSKEEIRQEEDYTKKSIGWLRDLFDTIPREKQDDSRYVYRGFAAETKEIEGMKKGDVVEYPEFLSTSVDEKVAQKFAVSRWADDIVEKTGKKKMVVMRIRKEKNSGLVVGKLSDHHITGDSEKEVLLPDHTRLRIDNIKEKADKERGYSIVEVSVSLVEKAKAASEIFLSKKKNGKGVLVLLDKVDKKEQMMRLTEPMSFRRIKKASMGDRILRIAEAVSRTEIVVERPEEDADKLNRIHYEIQKLVDRIGRNEKLESFVNRSDDEDEMKLEIGLSDHKAMEAIVEEILKTAKKLVEKYEFKMKAE